MSTHWEVQVDVSYPLNPANATALRLLAKFETLTLGRPLTGRYQLQYSLNPSVQKKTPLEAQPKEGQG